jgi:hypothetical protein
MIPAHDLIRLSRGEIDHIMDRITTLFSDQPALIARYNTFLPEGYALICSKNRHSEPRVHVVISTPDPDDTPVRRILPFMTPKAEEAFAELQTADTMAEIMRTDRGKRTEAALQLLRDIKLWIPASTYREFVRHLHIDAVPDAREVCIHILLCFVVMTNGHLDDSDGSSDYASVETAAEADA